MHRRSPERWDLEDGLALGLPALRRVHDDGLASAIGVASMSTPALLAGARSGAVDLVMSAGYTLADHDAETDLLPACRQHGVGIVAAAVFNGGLLASRPTQQSTFDYQAVPEDVLDRTRRIDDSCAAHRVPLAAVALQFPLEDPVVRSVVVGGVTPDQIRENLAHVSTPVPQALWTQLRDEGL